MRLDETIVESFRSLKLQHLHRELQAKTNLNAVSSIFLQFENPFSLLSVVFNFKGCRRLDCFEAYSIFLLRDLSVARKIAKS